MAMELLSCDLVEEILSCVPARSLARLRYTCKQWETLVADPRFVNKHLSRMRGREQQFTVFSDVPRVDPSPGSTISCVGVDFNELNKPCLNVEVLKPVSSPSSLYVTNMFHCDGLLLYVTSTRLLVDYPLETRLLVLNPLLKQKRWINCGYGYYHSMYAYGLGYISNQSSSPYDYKVVRFPCAPSDGEIFEDSSVEVYEFKSDCWRVVFDKSFDGFFGSPESSVCLRGTPYWICYNKHGGKSLSIQSFNFSKDRFEPLFLPSLSIGSSILWEDSLSLGIFRGDQLCLLREFPLAGRIHIWVMIEKTQHWSSLMTVATPEFPVFHAYSSHFIENNGKLVLSVRNLPTASISIDIVGENQECQKFECESCVNRTICGCYYVPSLLQVPCFSR